MHDTIKAIAMLLLLIGGIASALCFAAIPPIQGPGYTLAAVAILGLIVLIRSGKRRECIPDFLEPLDGPRLERDGLNFKLLARDELGRCYLDLHFQNRYDLPRNATVLLQPSRGFWLNRPAIVPPLQLSIFCPAGGYGIVSIPWAVPVEYQGRVQSFDIGSSVSSPQGVGSMIRFRSGEQMGTAGHDRFRMFLTLGTMLAGDLILHKATQVKLEIPIGVEETIADAAITSRLHWSLENACENSDGIQHRLTDELA